MSVPVIIVLCPNDSDFRTRALRIPDTHWKAAVRAVEKTGYGPNTFAGLDRRTARMFAEHLQSVVSESDRVIFKDLALFLLGHGASGVVLSRSSPDARDN